MKRVSKEELYNDLDKYFKTGLLRIIYEDDINLICNASNEFYLCFPGVKHDSGYQLAYLATAKNLRSFVSDPTYLYKLLTTNKKYAKSGGALVDNQLFNELLRLKQKTDIEGPSKGVDLELEEEIIKKGKSR